MHGPTFSAILPLMDAGVASLRRGGFGSRAGLAYAALLNTAMSTIAIGDDRLLLEEDGPRDHATMMSEFQNAAKGRDIPALLEDDFIAPFTEGAHRAVAQRELYYRFIVETTIAGLTTGLPHKADSP